MVVDYLEAAKPVSGKYVPIGNSGIQRVHVNPWLASVAYNVGRLSRV